MGSQLVIERMEDLQLANPDLHKQVRVVTTAASTPSTWHRDLRACLPAVRR